MEKLAIITYGMVFGGCEKVIATIANEFVKQNIKCSIITFMNTENSYNLLQDVEHIKIAEKSGKQSGFKKIKCCLKIRKTIKDLNPDIILIMPEEISSIMIPFLLGLHIPIVVSERNNPWKRPLNKINRVLRQIFYKYADGYVFQTEEAKSFFPIKIQQKGIVILNPLDISRLPGNIPKDRKNEVVAIGRLEKQKNHELLIRSFANFSKKYPNYKLVIYGNGSEKENLLDLAKSLMKPEKYIFNNATNDILQKINDASMFVLSSDYEGLPNALIEAMAIGLPCISTDCPSGGPKELIENGVNGLLIPTKNESELTRTMISLAENKEYANRLGMNAYQIRNLVNPDDIINKWKNYLESKCYHT